MRKILVVMGSCFLLVSGMLYGLERVLSEWEWSVQFNRIVLLHGNPPNRFEYAPGLMSDWFVPLFLVIGVVMLLAVFYRKIAECGLLERERKEQHQETTKAIIDGSLAGRNLGRS